MEGAHECVAGTLTETMIKILTRDGQDFIAEVDFTLGKGTMRPYWIRGQIIMIPAETYDMLVFSLLRAMYGLDFPKLLMVKFTNFGPLVVDGQPMTMDGARFIVSKRFNDRELRVKDYFPLTKKNYEFRFRLCLLIYFCKFVGTDFDLRYVRVMEKVPFMWRIGAMGARNAKTVDPKLFSLLFRVDMDLVSKIYAGQRRVHNDDSPPASNHGSDKRVSVFNHQVQLLQNPNYVKPVNPHDSTKVDLHSKNSDPIVRSIIDKLNGLVSDKGHFDDLIDKGTARFTKVNLNPVEGLKDGVGEDPGEVNDAILTEVLPREIEYSQLKGSMFDQVVSYFRAVDFDTDLIRACIYVRENPVRSARGNRSKFKLGRGAEIVQKIIEENYVLLSGPYPFKIFRLR